MTYRFVCAITAAVILTVSATAGENATTTTSKVPRTADGHPDLSGTWTYAIDLPPVGLKQEVNGSVSVRNIDQSARRGAKTPIRGARPSTAAPSYKPEFQTKVKYLAENESKNRVGVETVITAWVRLTPEALRVDLPRQMERFGLDPDEYRHLLE